MKWECRGAPANKSMQLPSQDERFMKMAIEIARQSKSEPRGIHPMVGAIATKNDQVVGTAYRGQRGLGEHAEYILLESILRRKDVVGATVYTTLEPCTTRHHPKIPCAERLIDRGVSRVVIGMLDPNQNICGRGVRLLRKAGIAVDLFSEYWMKRVEVQNRKFIRDQENREARLIPCGLGQRGSPQDFRNFADRTTREWILVAQNLRNLLSRSNFLPHVRRLLASGATIKLVLATPEIMKAIGPKPLRHLVQSVNDLKKFYFSLSSPRQKRRLKVYFNEGAISLSVQVRDPDNPARALLVFTPKWATDIEPENRLYCVLDGRHHKILFDKLYGPIPGMMQSDSRNLRQMCAELEIQWVR